VKITVFTSNQPRHIALIRSLSEIAEEVYCIQECNTVFPGQVEDFFKKSDVMKSYFERVISAEKNIFGSLKFLPPNVRSMSIKSGDLNALPRESLSDALDSDVYIVFGASFIKGFLIEFLVQNKAINIHMGLSPYYRGSSCNFWALYDENPGHVGATIHLLSKGLDSGPMLYHCVPKLADENPFEFTMKTVKVAHSSLVSKIGSGEIFSMPSTVQSSDQELRYTRNSDFTDEIAAEFLARKFDTQQSKQSFEKPNYPKLLNPYFG
jgi:folate-dependent phosphoribosylglycinamide formyltransferase PurN